ncbi:MAG: amidohydrolase family protein [Clostridia bacterium]|nr:amidohydrolase family protein [Clostridia bacterium]
MTKRILYTNGRIYTENPAQPWAEAFITEDDKFAYVGDEAGSLAFAKADETVDLGGKVVIPGLIDGHTHPGTVAKTFWHARIPRTYDKDELLAYIKQAAEEFPKETNPYFYCENYFTETFGEEGPQKEVLDEIIPDRPARIQDFSDHACWYNSIALDMLKDENGIPHAPSPMGGEGAFIKNKDGEYTGNCLESAPDFSDLKIYEAIGWEPPIIATEEMLTPFFDMLKENGTMGLMDGLTEGEESLQVIYEMDKAGKFGMFYEGSVCLEEIGELEETIATLRDWQEKYTTDHIKIRVVKFFIDGVNDHGDSFSVDPLLNDPTGTYHGEAFATTEELTEVLVRLNKEGLDMHIHTVCDGSFRRVCDAVEAAKAICGDAWQIKVTMAHCELIHPDDVARPAKLGIYIDATPHWAGGYSDEGVQLFFGYDKWATMFDHRKLIEAGVKVGFSSDVFNYTESWRANPYVGMQIGMTRVDPEVPLNPERYPGSMHPPASAKFTIEQLIHGYTAVNAERMRLDHIMGSIEAGKIANFVVLKEDIFTYPAEKLGKFKPDRVYFEGKKGKIKE